MMRDTGSICTFSKLTFSFIYFTAAFSYALLVNILKEVSNQRNMQFTAWYRLIHIQLRRI